MHYTTSAIDESECAFTLQRQISAKTLEKFHSIRTEINTTELSLPIHKISAWLVAPVLAGFATWLHTKIHDKHAFPLGVMREGRLLNRLIGSMFNDESKEVFFNRHFSLLAAYNCGDDEALINWLTRARLYPLTHAKLANLLPSYIPSPSLEKQLINVEEAQRLTLRWRAMHKASPIYSIAQDAEKKLLHHWHRSTAHNSTNIYALMDFACAGNIQRSLQTVFHHHGISSQLIGLNFATTQGTIWAKQKGCEIHGFLSEDGNPEWMGSAYARTPELMEIFAAIPQGPLIDYRNDGSPISGPSLLSTAQQNLITSCHDLILSYAKIFYQKLGDMLTPDLCRIIWARFLTSPLSAEVSALADWPLDTNLDGTGYRILAPTLKASAQSISKHVTAWPAGSMLRSSS